jgi:hypothetical protein
MNEKYPIAVDKPSNNVKEWSWNEKYLNPPMLKLIQDHHRGIENIKSEVQTIHMKYDAALMKIAELEKRIDQLELAS